MYIMYILHIQGLYIHLSVISILFINGKVHEIERHFHRNENSIRKKERTKVQWEKPGMKGEDESERDKRIDRH